ncbi:MAG: dihydrolipoyl dehydrogenase [Parafilimonas sp.]
MKHYDAIVIGSGQGGTPLAKKLAKQGLKTAIVERRFIGGTCINDGCTPTKTMVASARMMHLAKQSKALGITIKDAQLNFKKVISRKNKIIEDFRNGAEKGLQKTEGLDIIFGEARFVNNKELKIVLREGGEKNITANKIFINVGCRPTVPKINGLDSVAYLDSTSIMELKKLPEHLIIIGAGYISLEFGQMFRRFGSNITMLEHSERFLSREDEDVSDEIKKFLEDEDIKILTNCEVKKVSSKDENVSVTVTINKKEKKISGSHILIATGRTPNTDALHLSNTNIKTDERGHIIVNEKLETTAEGIYALGDVKGGPEFTHISYNDYIIIYKNLFKNGNESIKKRLVPYCMFTDPQLGRIGLSEQEASKKNINFKVAKLPMTHVARAIETGETTGFMKAIVDADSKQILGAAIIGEQGGEIMSMLELAMMGNISYEVLRSAVFAHPLYAESLNNLFMQFDENR